MEIISRPLRMRAWHTGGRGLDCDVKVGGTSIKMACKAQDDVPEQGV